MRCQKCNKRIPLFSDFCPNCGAKKASAGQKPKKSFIKIAALMALIAAILLLGAAALVYNSNLPNKSLLQNYLGASFLFCVTVLCLLIVFSFFKSLIKNIISIGQRPFAGVFSIIVIIGIIALAGGIFRSASDYLAWKEAGSETGNIAIRAKAETISPFSILSIRVKNLETADVATSVIFESENGNTTTIPAVEVSADIIKVPVPPYFDKDGNLASGSVKVKVIQAERLDDGISVKTSNYFSSRITPLPELDSRIPAGKLSGAYIAAVLDSIDDRLAKVSAEDAELRQALTASRKAFEDLFQKIDKVVKNPNEKIILKTNKGSSVTLNANDLKMLDRIFWGFLEQYKKSGFISQGPFFKIVPAAYAVSTICQAYQDIWEYRNITSQPCEQKNLYDTGFQKMGEKLPEAAQLAWSPVMIMVGGAVGGLGTAANLSTINQIGLSVTFSTAMDVLIQGGTTLESVGTNILTTIGDKVLNGDFLGIMVPTAIFCLHVYEDLPKTKALPKEAKQPTAIIVSNKTNPQTVNFIENSGSGTKISNIPVPANQATALTDTKKSAEKSPTAPAKPKPKTTTPTPAAPKTTTPAPAAPKTAAPKTATPAPAPAPTPDSLHDLGQPTGTAAPKIEFTLSQSNFSAKVGESFSYSFCRPALTRTSDICTASATNPKNGLPPYTFYVESGSSLPFGLSLSLNGLLTGTPTAAGSKTVNICAKDTGGFYACQRITVNVEQKEEVYLYDGHYTVNCSGSWQDNCCINGSIEVGLPDSYRQTMCMGNSAGGEDYYRVTKNILSDNKGHQTTVSASGDAQIIYDYSTSHYVTNYKFSRSESGEIQVNSTENTTIKDWGINCTKTFETKCSGRKDY